jgi:hypothetical protein
MVLFALSSDLNLQHLTWYRLVPAHGMRDHQGATTAGLSYGLFALGAAITARSAGLAHGARSVLIVSSAVLMIALFWTQARGPIIGTVTALLVYVGSTSRRGLRIGAAVTAAVVALALLAHPLSRQVILERGGSYRLDIWQEYASLLPDLTLLGYGQLADIGVQIEGGFVMEHPHNLVFSAYVLGGALAAMSMAVMIFGGVLWGYRFGRAGGSYAPFCIAVALAIAGSVDYALLISPPNWFWPTFWLPIGLFIGTELTLRNGLPQGWARPSQLAVGGGHASANSDNACPDRLR